MPPKKELPPPPTAEEIRQEAEELAIREYYEKIKVAVRLFKDTRGHSKAAPEPRLKHFSILAANDPRVSKSQEAVYALYRRARSNRAADPIAIAGRPSKMPDALQLHCFAKSADDIVILFLKFIIELIHQFTYKCTGNRRQGSFQPWFTCHL